MLIVSVTFYLIVSAYLGQELKVETRPQQLLEKTDYSIN